MEEVQAKHRRLGYECAGADGADAVLLRVGRADAVGGKDKAAGVIGLGLSRHDTSKTPLGKPIQILNECP